MKPYLIGYDLNRPRGESAYPDLINAIKENFPGWWHCLDSTWIVRTEKSAVAIRDLLKPYLDSNDELLVVGLTGEGAWTGFDQNCSNWLKNNL